MTTSDSEEGYTYIASYILPDDAAVDAGELTFSRAVFTRTGSDVSRWTVDEPPTSLQGNTKGAIWKINNTNKESIGVFACKYGGETVTTTIKMNLESGERLD